MTPERWRQVQQVLDQALAFPPAQRAPKLGELCGPDSDLRREVSSLLALEEDAETFLGSPAVMSLGTPLADVGRRIGSYRLMKLLGCGGMGAVYKAARQDDFDLQVALKLVHPSAVRPAILKRFHTERQILARLEHAHIARLLDGGTAEDGRPYLVMEHIDGQPIDVYCDQHRLDVNSRIELFRQVCGAVAFAHRNLVVHRDLKPGNVLVATDGQVKLLDFGIAKLIDEDSGLTRTVERPMTPRWASPEQVSRRPITTASDVYSLGLLLHQLLTGRLPCGLDSCTDAEIPERVCLRDPDRPSAMVMRDEVAEVDSGGALSAHQLAGRRNCDAATLRRQLTGDVDAIVLKALRKEPDQRYGSVEKLEEDLHHFLEGFPVSARRGDAIYRGSKYLRRRRWAIAAVLATLAAAGLGLWREVERLEAERRRSDQVAGFLKGMLEVTDPDESSGGLDVKRMLDSARNQLSAFDDDPVLLADLADILAQLYTRRGHFSEAHELLEISLTAQRETTSGSDPVLAKRLNNLAAIHLETGDYAGAEAVLRRALSMHEKLADQSETAVVTANNLATALLYQGRYEEAEKLYRRGFEVRARRHGADSAQAASSLRSLATLHLTRGDLTRAESVAREVLVLRRRLFGDDHTAVASAMALLGSIHRAHGELERAASMHSEALEIRLRRLGSDHLLVARSQRFLAEILIELGDLETARVLISRALGIIAATTKTDDWRRADTEGVLGSLWAAEGRSEEAGACLRAAAEELRRARGEAAWQTRQAVERWHSWQLRAGDGDPSPWGPS